MDSKRQQKVNSQLQKDLSDIFQKDLKGEFGNAFITVLEVKISPDLSQAKIYLSVMLAPDKEGFLKEVRIKTKQIRNLLGIKVRHQFRIVPELLFFLDDTAEYASKIDELLSKLDIPPLKEGEEIELD
jgi:ribosome-binding factor A